MATIECTLKKGLTEGDKTHTHCIIREPTAGDVIAASEESEKVVALGTEPVLVTSPTLVGINTLRRQIVSIGDITGPLEREMLDRLSAEDLNLVQQHANKLERAGEVAQRGRTDGEGEGPADSD